MGEQQHRAEVPRAPMRHPLAARLRAVWLNRKTATAAELEAAIEQAQLDVEKLWGRAGEGSSCAQPGCNYRRYPASRFCMYHVTGRDTLAVWLRKARQREAKDQQ